MEDDDFEPPKLKIVSSQNEVPDTNHARDRCLWHVEYYTRELAANMIRVIRGAGRPHLLLDQLLELHNAIADAPPGLTVGEVVEAILEALGDGLKTPRGPFADEVEAIQAGALRSVAGRIVRQPLQEAAGDRDLWDAFYQLERAREESRKKYLAAQNSLPKARKARAALARKIVAKSPKEAASEPEIEHTGSTAEFMKKRAAQLAKKRDR
jgi:hypothetical protein